MQDDTPILKAYVAAMNMTQEACAHRRDATGLLDNLRDKLTALHDAWRAYEKTGRSYAHLGDLEEALEKAFGEE